VYPTAAAISRGAAHGSADKIGAMTTRTDAARRVPLPTLADLLVPRHPDRALLRSMGLVVAGAALTAVSAQLSVKMPWTDVPYTGSTAAVLLVGVALGWQLGAASMLLYVLVGVAGAPVFNAGGAGFDQLLGVTGGYLLGFILAAGFVGWLAQRGWDRSVAGSASLMILGNLVIYAIGVPILAAVAHLAALDALWAGAIVFLPWDAFKIVVAAVALPLVWHFAGRR
jgi:biotin transport system substrate-specific component